MTVLKIIGVLITLAIPTTHAFSTDAAPTTKADVEYLLGTYNSGSRLAFLGSSLSIKNPKKDQMEIDVKEGITNTRTFMLSLNDFQKSLQKSNLLNEGIVETRYNFSIPFMDTELRYNYENPLPFLFGPIGLALIWIEGRKPHPVQRKLEVLMKFVDDQISAIKVDGAYSFTLSNAVKTESGQLFVERDPSVFKWDF